MKEVSITLVAPRFADEALELVVTIHTIVAIYRVMNTSY